MDWTALAISMKLAAWTCAVLLPFGLILGRGLGSAAFRGRVALEAVIALPLVLPPTVLGYYLLVGFGPETGVGGAFQNLFGRPLVFSFEGILAASLIFNLPFAVQPMQRAFEQIPPTVREAAWCSGLSSWRTFLWIELPLAWPGVVSAMVLVFAHTLGEFGVVLMVGGNIPGETQTVAIAIYDRVQSFENSAAAAMSAGLLGISFVAIAFVFLTARRAVRPGG